MIKPIIWTVAVFFVFALGTGIYASTKRAETLRRVEASTVVIHVDQGKTTSQGSGTVIGRNGEFTFILTCYHVIEDAKSIKVHASSFKEDTKKEKREAFVEQASEKDDLAIIFAKGLDLPVLPVAKVDPELYDAVYVLGAPHHEQGIAAEGIITALEYPYDGQNFWRVTNGFIQPGISGGTATNTDGELIGVPARGTDDVPALGLLIPRNYILSYLKAAHAQF